jgi:hypothetical protein
MEPTPNIPRRFAKFGNRPLLPIEWLVPTSLALQKATSQTSGKGNKHHARNLNVGMQSTM